MENKETVFAGQGHTRSIGEKIFDWTTYSGINGIGTFLITIPVAFSLKHGKLSGFNTQGVHLLENKVFSALPGWLRTPLSTSLMSSTVLMQGGNAMLLPVAMAEHFKVPIVTGLNRMLGDKTDPSAIEEAPKQTLGTLFAARLRAFGVVFLSFFGANLLFGKSLEKFETAVGRAYQNFRNPAAHTADESLKHFQLGKIGALDVFATAAASILLYDGSHKMAERAQRKRVERVLPSQGDPAGSLVASDTPTPQVSKITRANDMLATAAEHAVG